MSEVWFLTIINDGRVSVTSIMAENSREAEVQAYSELTRLYGQEIAWTMADYRQEVNSRGFITWDYERAFDPIRASLIKG